MIFKYSEYILIDTNTSGIYKIYFTDCPEVFYIGASKNIRSRFKSHVFDLLGDSHKSNKLQENFNFYGLENLVLEVLELVSGNSNLRIRETFHLNNYSNECLYNKEKFSNICLSDTRKPRNTCSKLAVAMQGNQNKRGKLNTDITIKRMSVAKKGTIRTDENKLNISISMSGEKHHRTSLTNEIVYKIKETLATKKLSTKEVANLYNVTPKIVTNIRVGHCWTSVCYP